MSWNVIQADCVEAMRELEEASIDAIVCDPPYGLEFMGKEWDRLDWRDGGAITKPGIGDRPTAWPSFGGETANPTCANCGGRKRGKNRCGCGSPDWRVKGERYDAGARLKARSRAMQEWHEVWATEALRILKPGGHLLAFGGTRTYHRLACAIEDAGFEIRDCIAWMYGNGFPKSLDVSKAIDKAAGAEREVVGPGRWNHVKGDNVRQENCLIRPGGKHDETAPATPEAEQWQGWGTALKPAYEPIVVARKPLIGTVAQNVLEHGTGALNIDACRIGAGEGGERDGEESADRRYTDEGSTNFAPTPGPRGGDAAGRWPANIALSPEAAEELDRQSGERKSAKPSENVRYGEHKQKGVNGVYEAGLNSATPNTPPYGDKGGASRFFYVAKASRAERNAGLDGFEEREKRDTYGDGLQGPRPHTRDDYEWTRKGARNSHPTVKPIDLMRWLVRLVTPPGGTVLDPFAGSGTTGCAAVLEGFDFIGIEREEEYAEIARARIKWWAKYPGADTEAVLHSDVHDLEARGQGSLLDLGDAA